VTTPDVRWIDDNDDFAALVDRLLHEQRYALDTEFHRERTFFPQLALMQVATADEIALVDPLAVDVTHMAKLFAGDALAVVHAAQQDIDVLTHAVGAIPTRLYDTQIAAGFIGYGTPSLSALVEGELGIRLTKGDRLTDWLRRPLSEAQRIYAAADVVHLLELHDRLVAATDRVGRSAWVEEACEELRTRPASGSTPDDAWMRLKDARSLRPRARAVAQAVAAWRERRAMEVDLPVRQILSDLAILGVAQRQPVNANELAQARGVDSRHANGRTADALLQAVAVGRESEPPDVPRGEGDLDRSLRPAITLVSAWVSQVARDQRIDTAILATRADITALLADRPDARLAHGWRAELIGEAIKRLVTGRAGLTFDSSGRLRLIDVPEQPVGEPTP
jgi:ribonuclease D